MGGLGKTTLARYVFNDAEIKSYFDIRGWICVSADYKSGRLIEYTLNSVSWYRDDIKYETSGWDQAKRKLKNKKFFLVLDDYRHENIGDWSTIRSLLHEGLSGSKIIVTTRSQKVADTVGTAPSIIPNLLSEKDCWSLFCCHANLDSNGTSIFEMVGKEISRKCSGFPLAAMAVGGMLRDKRRVEEWEDILNHMSSVSDDVMSVFRMSYNDLPFQLKLCFSFFALFPEDYKFEEDEVVLLWIGAGLIQSSETEKRSKLEVSRDCFHKLLSRSLFLPVEKKYGVSKQLYVMHDFVRQLAQQVSLRNLYVANDENALMINSTRHLSFDRSRFQTIVQGIIEGAEVTVLPMRTLFGYGGSDYHLPKRMDEIFLRLKCLRALSLNHSNACRFVESIHQMKLLRYLDLKSSNIQILPRSITSLHNLEILSLHCCLHLIQLPENIEKLQNLWYLDISLCLCLKELPRGIKELKRLEKLTHFMVDEKLSVASLGNLKLLRGSLEISGLENVASPEDAAFARLSEKRLDELVLTWNGSWSYDWKKKEKESKILEQLQPHENLKVLRIANYGGHMIPCWFTAGSLSCLTVLEIKDCANCSTLLTPNNLVSLKELCIKNCVKMEVHLETMPNLKTLCLDQCSNVGCVDTFSSVALDVLKIKQCTMSELFKKKVRLGFPNARDLFAVEEFGSFNFDSKWWYLPDISIIAGNYNEEMKVEELYVEKQSSIEYLPQWVCKAKSLKKITVKECPSLKILLPSADILLSLTEIKIYDCCELTFVLSQDPLPDHFHVFTPNNLVSLKKLCIRNCAKMEVFLAWMPKLKTLCLENCSYVKCTDTFSTVALDVLQIKHCTMSELFKEKVRLGVPNARNLKRYDLCRDISITEDPLWYLPDISITADYYDEQMKVEELCVENQSSIEHLPQWVCKAISLKKITVKDCPALKKLLPIVDIPPSLTEIEVYNCCELTSIRWQDPLPDHCYSLFTLYSFVSLKKLNIKNCSKMEVHIAGMPNLQTLCLENCSNVGCSDTFSTVALYVLQIKQCTMSELFKEKVRLGFPYTRYLRARPFVMDDVERFNLYRGWYLSDISMIVDKYDIDIKLEELYVEKQSSIELLPQWVSKASFLQKMCVKECPALKQLLPSADIPPLLTEIEVYDCCELTSIRSQDPLSDYYYSLFTSYKFASLKKLSIRNCSKLEVHLEGMQNLQSLYLKNCSYVGCTDTFSIVALSVLLITQCAMSELFKEKVRLGIPNARCLRVCPLVTDDIERSDSYRQWWYIPDISIIADNYDEEMKIERIFVEKQSSIEHLPQWVCKAKSLKNIEVAGCPSLKKLLPSADFPPSLIEINVYDCCELTSILPQEPLLDHCYALYSLSIKNCPKMEVHLTRMPNLKDLCLENCSFVGCTETFSTAALDNLTLKAVRMSELFKEKVRLGCPNFRYLHLAPTNTLCSISDIIPDYYDKEMKVHNLCLSDDSIIEHLPEWVCKAKSLEVIQVKQCPSLKILIPNGETPPSLMRMTIHDCTQLTSIVSQESLSDIAKPLASIDVARCSSLKVLLLAWFTIVRDCLSLEFVHKDRLLHHSISHLLITNCPLISQKLRGGDEQLWSVISPGTVIKVDGDDLEGYGGKEYSGTINSINMEHTASLR